MNALIILSILALWVLLVLGVFFLRARSGKKRATKAEIGDYRKRCPLAHGDSYVENASLSPKRKFFAGVLEHALRGEMRVLGNVRVEDAVVVKPVTDDAVWKRFSDKISGKYFDFVLCDKDSLEVMAVVELDDKSLRGRKRRNRDAFLEEICGSAALPLVYTPMQRAYSHIDLQSKCLWAFRYGTNRGQFGSGKDR